MVRLANFAARRITQLSGGQRQRVALARALVNRPKVLLLDEPLGALDLKLREEMQVELKRIQCEVGITFIYVTHDQDEALAMSDRLAVFSARPHRAGRVARRGLRASGLGLRGRLRRHLQRARGRPRDAPPRRRTSPSPCGRRRSTWSPPTASGRPDDGEVRVTARSATVVYLGDRTRYTVDLDGGGAAGGGGAEPREARPAGVEHAGRRVRARLVTLEQPRSDPPTPSPR